MERLCEVQLLGAGKSDGFVFEADGISLVQSLLGTHDRILAALVKVTGGEPVSFIPIDARRGGEKIPKIVVPPQRERQHMVRVEGQTERVTAPP